MMVRGLKKWWVAGNLSTKSFLKSRRISKALLFFNVSHYDILAGYDNERTKQ